MIVLHVDPKLWVDKEMYEIPRVVERRHEFLRILHSEAIEFQRRTVASPSASRFLYVNNM